MFRIVYHPDTGLTLTFNGQPVDDPVAVTVYWDQHRPIATVTLAGPELDITAWAPEAQAILNRRADVRRDK